jgi:outer membrane protein assembly factor BamB
VVNTNTVQQLNSLYALNASTGATTWSVTVPSLGGGTPAPTVANGIVYLKKYQSANNAYNALTGALLWSSPLGTANVTIPVVANGVLYVASGTVLITANATTGAGLWNAVVGGNGAQIAYATVADGVVYVIISQPNNASTINTFHLPTAASRPPNGPTPSGPHRSRTL